MNATDSRAAAAGVLLELTPPLIQDDLLAHKEFRDAYGLSSAVVVSLAGGEVSILRSELFAAIREVLSGSSDTSVRDLSRRKWDLFLKANATSQPTPTLARGARQFVLPQFRLLTPDTSTRVGVLDDIAESVRLPTHERWREVVSARSLEDDEMAEFGDDVRDTLVNVARMMRHEMAGGQVSVSSVVPARPRYYSRLVGRYDGAASMSDHYSRCAAEILRDLCVWRPPDGVLGALMLSCSKIAVSMINVESLDNSSITKLFASLDERGDRLSQTGAIELGLRVLPRFPQLERHILSMVRQIRDDDVDRPESDYRLITGLFRLIDGELSRRRTLGRCRPYYRRCAALAQSTMAAREVRSGRIDTSRFTEWLYQFPSTWFHLQNYVDMRLEPRWAPGVFDARGMKAACIGRIVAAAAEFSGNIQGDSLRDVFLEGGDESVLELFKSDITCLEAYPGPLSATVDSSIPVPDELWNAVEQSVDAGFIDRPSLILFANAATMFDVSKDQAVRVAENLKANRHWISGIENRSEMVDVVMRLAVAAAACRSEALADQVRIAVRTLRSHKALFLNVSESIPICLSSAASRAGLQEWAEYVGEWLTEIAFLDMKEGEAVAFSSTLRCLMQIVPELWKTCARADAALQAQIGR